jgi:HPt (histidine-containing phosphotransfer) domain-containing protein
MPEDLQVIDDGVLAELRASVESDMAFVRDLVDAYIADSAGCIDAIEAAVAAEDAGALVRPAHTLKSSSATVGAMPLSATARTLEGAARSGLLDDDETQAAAARIRGEWEESSAALRAWLADAESP